MLKKPIGIAEFFLFWGTYAFGNAFEAFFINEGARQNHYLRKLYRLSYLRTKDDAEIDLIIERSASERILVEIKASSQVFESDARTLNAFCRSIKGSKAILISRAPTPKHFGSLRAVPWEMGLGEIFS